MAARKAPAARRSEVAGVLQGGLDASGLRFALIVPRFNEVVTENLRRGAEDCLERHGALAAARTVVRVPGAWEIPLAARAAAASGRFDAVIALGALVRGETAHFDLLAAEVGKGLAQVSFDTGVPVGFGVLTTETTEQAMERAGAKGGNKGWDAALAAIETANLLRRLR
jgi:6,7-dimethyl-8-ribityllumazine synthase